MTTRPDALVRQNKPIAAGTKVARLQRGGTNMSEGETQETKVKTAKATAAVANGPIFPREAINDTAAWAPPPSRRGNGAPLSVRDLRI